MFVTKNRDSSMTRPALADYLLLFRKPGDNAVPIKNDVSNEEWIDWARPVWLDIKETRTLNERVARDDADGRAESTMRLTTRVYVARGRPLEQRLTGTLGGKVAGMPSTGTVEGTITYGYAAASR